MEVERLVAADLGLQGPEVAIRGVASNPWVLVVVEGACWLVA